MSRIFGNSLVRGLVVLLFIKLNSGFAQNYQQLSTGLTYSLGQAIANSFVEFDNKLIVGGIFTSAGGTPTYNLATWDGSSWGTPLNGVSRSSGVSYILNCSDGGMLAQYGYVNSLVVFNGELYVGGCFNSASGVPCNNIAKWNGTSWSDVGGGVRNNSTSGSAHTFVGSMIVYDNELYVTGLFDTAGTTIVNNIAKWDGSAWSDPGIELGGAPLFHGASMAVMNNVLYIGGRFDLANSTPVENICAWDGSSVSPLGFGIPVTIGSVNGVTHLSVYNDNLYAGNPTTGISKWNGSSWSTVGGGLTTGALSGVANTTVLSGTDMIVAGSFLNSGTLVNTINVSYWNDVNWNHLTPVNIGYSGLDNCVAASSIFNGEFYFGGTFNYEYTNWTTQLRSVARLSDILAVDNNDDISLVQIYPNPTSGLVKIKVQNDSEIEEIIITSSDGKEIYKESVIGPHSEYHLDLNFLPEGIYFLTIKSEQVLQSSRFIIDRN